MGNKIKKIKGFTLIELLVVMAILGILATVGLGSFRTSQMKARDARRKSDLEQIQRALEMYHNDYNRYPASSNGEISIDGSAIAWGENGMMRDDNGSLYMSEVPGDPTGNPNYCYETLDNGISYRLYAKLENGQDAGLISPEVNCSGADYNYRVNSSNTQL
jgi:type II secretion system protein G